MRPRPIWAAYRQGGDALSRPCDNCGAPEGTWCTTDDDRRVRRSPCVSRCKPDSRATSTSGPVVHIGRDFSEPLHSPEEP